MTELAVAVIACTGATAVAQIEGQATWLWDVTTQDGDAVVEPGETATVSLTMDMDPDVNYPDGPVLFFGNVAFDLVGDAGAAFGQVTEWQLNPVLLAVLGDMTTTDGVSLFDVHALQHLEFNSKDDPIDVLSFTWEPTRYGSYSVEYTSSSWDFLSEVRGHAGIWTGTANLPLMEPWPLIEASISFAVVPVPPTLGPLLGATAIVIRRRR